MSELKLSVRFLSGKLRRFSVTPVTTILAIKEQLEMEQNLNEFEKISLYFGETELIEGTISEVARLEATELQAVAGANIEKAVKVIDEAHAALFKFCYSLEYAGNRHPAIAAVHQKLAKDASFLLQREDQFEAHVCEAALKLVHFLGSEVSSFLSFLAVERYGYQCQDVTELFLQCVDVGCHLLGKYGDESVEADIHDLLLDLEDFGDHLQIIPPKLHSVREAALSALEKIKDRKGIQCEGEQGDSENKGQDGLGNDSEEKVGEATAGKPERGEALDADVAGRDADAIQADQLSVDLEIAMRESAAEATAQEGAHIQEALLRSKIDSALQQVVVVLRLTKRNSDVLDAMLKDEYLQKVRAEVEEAGCEVLPDWARGAIVFVPLTEKQAMDAGVELRAHHIVIVQEYQSHVERALSSIPKKRRPLARRADPEHLNTATTEAAASDHNVLAVANLAYTPNIDNWHSQSDLEWYVERTFVHCPLPQAEENSQSVKSEPWGGVADARPLKLLRLST